MATSVASDMQCLRTAEDNDDEVGSQREDSYQELRLISLRQNEPSGKLGFSLRGGKEATGCSVGVFVSHVELAGQASKNGLRVGDQLIQVNGLQVSRATYDEVIELIRRTPKRDEIRLLVNYVGRIPFQEKSGEPIGWLQLDDMMTGAAKFAPKSGAANTLTTQSTKVSHKQANGYAIKAGNAQREKVSRTPNYQDDSAASSQSLTFTSSSTSSFGSAHSASSSDEEDHCHISPLASSASSSSSSSASTSSGCSISMSSLQSGNAAVDEPSIEIRVPGGRRTSEPFGCGVVKGPDEWPGIFVQHVKEASLAERVGLEPGDQLLKAEQFSLDELAFEEAIKLIKRLQAQQDDLLLSVRKGAALKHLAKGRCKQHQLVAAAPSVASSQATTTTTTTTTTTEETSAIGTDDSSNESSSAPRKPLEPTRTNTRRPLPRPPAQSPPAPPRAQRAIPDRRAAAQLENSISKAIESSRTELAFDDDCLSAEREQQQRQQHHLAPSYAPQAQRQPTTNCSSKSGARLTDSIERCDSANGHQSLDDDDNEDSPLAQSTQARQAPTASPASFTASRTSSPSRLKSIRAQEEKDVARMVSAPSRMDAAKSTAAAPSADQREISNASYTKHQTATSSTKRQDLEHHHQRQHDAGEQIKIVRQNCKLHQHGASIQHLVKMSPFAKESGANRQKVARHQQQITSVAVGQLPSSKQTQDLKRAAPLPSGQRFGPALQRYVSVDNLASGPMPQRCNSSMHLNRLVPQAAPVVVQQRLRQAEQELASSSQPQSRIYRRSNSVLGQTAASFTTDSISSSNTCCQFSQFQPNRDEIKRSLRASQCGFNQRSASNTRPCPIGPSCNCSRASRQMASMATMRHMQVNQRILSNGRYKRQNNTLAMSKFKARSEDKLNLMNVNLNYVQIGNLNQCHSLSGRMLKSKQLQQLQQQQPQISCNSCCTQVIAASRTARSITCNPSVDGSRTLCPSRLVPRVYPNCPDQQQQQQQQQQQVYQYATAMGMISNNSVAYRSPVEANVAPSGCTIKSLSSAKSCCAINRVGCAEQLVALPCATLVSSCGDADDVQTSCPCDTLSCSSSFYCPSEQQLLLMRRSGKSASLHPLGLGATSKKRASHNGASTDSSGYQSACNMGEKTRACSLLGQPVLKQRDTSQNLSTFNPQRPASRASGPTNKQQTGALVMLANGSQCNSACSPTSMSSSAYSPTNSPTSMVVLTNNQRHQPQRQQQKQQLRHQRHHDSSLSPLSSMSPSSHSPASSRSASPQPPSKQFISKQQMAKSSMVSSSKLAPRKQSRQSADCGKFVPCPPPMPIVGPDGRTLTRPTNDEPRRNRESTTICNDLHPKSRSHDSTSSSLASPPTTKPKLQHQRASAEHAIERAQQQKQQIGKLNRLCFVDELKMLAGGGGQSDGVAGDSSQAKSSSSSVQKLSSGEPAKYVDSSTLIKMINANNRAAGQQRKQQQQQQLNCSSCCQLAKSDAGKMTAGACCFGAGDGGGGGGVKSKFAALRQLESKSVKLRDEEDNKRRQHELLMEEFKTAHSKMFNKLRQTTTAPDKEQQQQLDGDRVESCGNQTVASPDTNNNQELKSSARC